MDTHAVPKQVFMRDFPRHEPIVKDSSSVMTYKTCPRKYFYRIVLGFVPKTEPAYFNFGSAYHKFRESLEVYHQAGKPPVEAYQKAVEDALLRFKKGGGNPLDDKWSFLNESRLMQSCEVALKFWLEEKKKAAIEVLAIEQPFSIVMDDGTVIAGRADQIVKFLGNLWGRDWKTSSKPSIFYGRSLEPNDQFTRYTYGESKLQGWDGKSERGRVQGQIIEVMFTENRKPPKIEVYTATRTLSQLLVWEKEHVFWVSMITQSRELDMYPMNEKSCAFCEFHSVCKSPSEAGQMHELKRNFKLSPWDCMANREDEP